MPMMSMRVNAMMIAIEIVKSIAYRLLIRVFPIFLIVSVLSLFIWFCVVCSLLFHMIISHISPPSLTLSLLRIIVNDQNISTSAISTSLPIQIPVIAVWNNRSYAVTTAMRNNNTMIISPMMVMSAWIRRQVRTITFDRKILCRFRRLYARVRKTKREIEAATSTITIYIPIVVMTVVTIRDGPTSPSDVSSSNPSIILISILMIWICSHRLVDRTVMLPTSIESTIRGMMNRQFECHRNRVR